MPKYDPTKVLLSVKQVLRGTLGLSLAGVMKSFPQDAESDVWDALRHEVSAGAFDFYMSDDDPAVPIYYAKTET